MYFESILSFLINFILLTHFFVKFIKNYSFWCFLIIVLNIFLLLKIFLKSNFAIFNKLNELFAIFLNHPKFYQFTAFTPNKKPNKGKPN